MNEISQSLESPFTWGIDEQFSLICREDPVSVEEISEQPIKMLIYTITGIYKYTISNDIDNASKNLKKAFEIWETIDHSASEIDAISFDVLLHILKATEYFFYKHVNDSKADLVLINLKDSNVFTSKIEKGTINGCKCLAWNCFFKKSLEKVIFYAREAIFYSPNCALWQYTLGKSLGIAKYSSVYTNISEEKHLLERCYEISKIPIYGVRLAQFYSKNKETETAKQLYLEIHQSKPSSVSVNLRLARAFTAYMMFDEAKACFDSVEEEAHETSMFLHYKGMYFKKQRQFEQAIYYLKKATDNNRNFEADIQYIITMIQAEKQTKVKTFDCIEHLKLMLIKYEKIEHDEQKISLHLAMQYYEIEQDYVTALNFFLKAIKLNPTNNILSNFENITIDWKTHNVYSFIKTEVLPKYYRNNANLSQEEQTIYQTLKELCEKHIVEEADCTTFS